MKVIKALLALITVCAVSFGLTCEQIIPLGSGVIMVVGSTITFFAYVEYESFKGG